MPTCNDPKCSCNRADGAYKLASIADHVREERGHTLDRLARVEGLTIEHRDHAVWITIDGFRAPVIVGHGSISIRTEFPDMRPQLGASQPPLRVQFGVSRDVRKIDRKHLAELIGKAAVNYRPYKEASELKTWFARTLGRTARIEGIVEGTAVVSTTLRLSLDEAEEFAAFCDRVRKDTP